MIIAIVLLTALASIDAAAFAAYTGLSKNKVPKDLTETQLKPEIEFEIERQKIERQKTQEMANRWTGWGEVNCASQNVSVIQGVTWPDHALSLNLEDNQIKTMNGVHFSDNLTIGIHLSGNKGITLFQNTHFPIDLQVLHLDRMDLSYQALASIDWSSFRKLMFLSVGRNQATFDESFGFIQFPQSLKTLCIDWFTLQSMMESGQSMSLPNLERLWLTQKKELTAAEEQVIGRYFENHHLHFSCFSCDSSQS